jgi:hypothetical protein
LVESKLEEIVNDIDVEKETFTLEEVMELTLLHAQQLQLLKATYEYVILLI